MTEKEINDFEKNQAQLESLHTEISNLAKKSSNDALNKFKLKFVNQTITESNNILGKKHRPFNDFEQFDESDIPTNSDVTLILGQYLNCMEKLRADNIMTAWGGEWVWRMNGKESAIKTGAPQKIKK